MRSVRRKTQGMTLLEVLVVVAIAASIIGGVVVILQGQNDERRREAAVQRQSSDMATLVKAARQFGAVNAVSWADGTRDEVSLDDLVDAGLLPDNFGTDDGSGDLGVTPIGQRYRVYAIKDGDTYDDPTVEDGTVRSVILDLGEPNAGRVANVAVGATPEGLQTFKEAVALMTTRDERIPMGVLVVGTDVVRGIGRSFTKDVLDWIEDAPAHPAVVALVGFHDLDGGGDDEAEVVPPVVAETQYDTCIVKSDVDGCSGGGGCASWSAPTCDAGWDELAQPRICGSGGQVVASTTPGVMVSGINQVTLTSGNIGWGVCDTWEETQYIATTTLNGGPIGTTICEWSTTTSSFDSDGVCEYVTESGAAPTLGRGGVHGTMCCLPRPETP